MNDLLGKAIRGLECCSTYDDYSRKSCRECPYNEPDGKRSCKLHQMRVDAITLLKAQGEIIDALLKVGYPHNFQMEEPWIVNYMYAITDVIKKAVNLRNG